MNELVEKNLNIATILSKKYAIAKVCAQEDLYQEAVIGMIKALKNYDSSKGEYRARAYVFAERSIQKYIHANSHFFKYHGAACEKMFWKTGTVKLAYEWGEEAVDRLCEKENISRDKMDKLFLFLNAKPKKIGDGNLESTTMFYSACYNQAEDNLQKEDLKLEIAKALSHLSPKQELILRELYFSDEPKTMAVVAEKIGVSRQRVDQIQKSAIEKLKNILLKSPSFQDLISK